MRFEELIPYVELFTRFYPWYEKLCRGHKEAADNLFLVLCNAKSDIYDHDTYTAMIAFVQSGIKPPEVPEEELSVENFICFGRILRRFHGLHSDFKLHACGLLDCIATSDDDDQKEASVATLTDILFSKLPESVDQL
jgi:hypothetical protein